MLLVQCHFSISVLRFGSKEGGCLKRGSRLRVLVPLVAFDIERILNVIILESKCVARKCRSSQQLRQAHDKQTKKKNKKQKNPLNDRYLPNTLLLMFVYITEAYQCVHYHQQLQTDGRIFPFHSTLNPFGGMRFRKQVDI